MDKASRQVRLGDATTLLSFYFTFREMAYNVSSLYDIAGKGSNVLKGKDIRSVEYMLCDVSAVFLKTFLYFPINSI